MSTSETPRQATRSVGKAQAGAEGLLGTLRSNWRVVLTSALLGLAAAAVFAAYRAVSLDGEDASGRLVEAGWSLLWPGALIFAGVAAVVCFGWKANLD